MDYSKILVKYYSGISWTCGDTYDTLEWNDTTIPKPTEEELELKYDDLLVDEMREERNRLLKECDVYALVDYPHETEAKRQAWLDYREELRRFPSIWLPEMPFPTPPTE